MAKPKIVSAGGSWGKPMLVMNAKKKGESVAWSSYGLGKKGRRAARRAVVGKGPTGWNLVAKGAKKSLAATQKTITASSLRVDQ